jgi:hypothetical protein
VTAKIIFFQQDYMGTTRGIPQTRRGRGEGSVYFKRKSRTEYRDQRHHRGCAGKWRGEVNVKIGGE